MGANARRVGFHHWPQFDGDSASRSKSRGGARILIDQLQEKDYSRAIEVNTPQQVRGHIEHFIASNSMWRQVTGSNDTLPRYNDECAIWLNLPVLGVWQSFCLAQYGRYFDAYGDGGPAGEMLRAYPGSTVENGTTSSDHPGSYLSLISPTMGLCLGICRCDVGLFAGRLPVEVGNFPFTPKNELTTSIRDSSGDTRQIGGDFRYWPLLSLPYDGTGRRSGIFYCALKTRA